MGSGGDPFLRISIYLKSSFLRRNQNVYFFVLVQTDRQTHRHCVLYREVTLPKIVFTKTKDIQILPKCPRVCTSDAANAEILAFHNWFNAERDTFIAGTISYLPYLKNGSNQLIVTQYTLSIYPSLHNQPIRTLFKAHMVVNSIIKPLSACPMSTIMFFIIKDQGIFLLNNN